MASRGAPYVLGLLVAVNFVNYLDRYTLPAVVSSIQDEFHLLDAQVGLLGTAFLLVYALGALPFGLWADRGLRRVVIGTGVAVWSVATLFTGLARDFRQLLVTRAVLGVGEASYFPAGTALLGDFFGKGKRARALSIRDAGSVIGIAAGYTGGGLMAQHFGWRWAFYFAALPGLVLALLAFRMPEPPRGEAEGFGPRLRRADEASWRTFGRLWRIPTLRATILAQVLLFWVLGAISTFLPLYIHRRYGLAVGAAATLGGGILIAGGLVGTLAGGWLGDRLSRVSATAYLKVGSAGFVLGALFVGLALFAPSVPLFGLLAFLAALSLYLYSAPFTALLQNIVIPSLRASAVTLTLLVAHLLGDAWSPAALGALSDALHSLQRAMLLTTPLVLIGAALVAATGLRSADADTQAMEREWRAKG